MTKTIRSGRSVALRVAVYSIAAAVFLAALFQLDDTISAQPLEHYKEQAQEAARKAWEFDQIRPKAGAAGVGIEQKPAMVDLTRPGMLKVESSIWEETRSEIPGIFFYRLEPMFYTGFAPRIQDPRMVHTYLGRGNQLRVTAVLSEQALGEYLQDIALRYLTVQALIDEGKLELTQNTQWERFKTIIDAEGIMALAAGSEFMDDEAYRAMALTKMAALNPGRVFHIKIDMRERLRDWAETELAGAGASDPRAGLAVVNGMLPTRFKLTNMTAALAEKLDAAAAAWSAYAQAGTDVGFEAFFAAASDLFHEAAGGVYSINEHGYMDHWEFTAIYPVGTLNQYVQHEGKQIPLYPCPGVRQVCYHQRTKVADHISETGSYGFTPWIPYMHVGSRLHNSFHSLWFRIDARSYSEIPDEWRAVTEGKREDTPYPYLWLVSRGPMSQGCTHVNAGFLNELRQIFPSTEENLSQVITFRNKYQHYDVFDIDGNGEPEVMGVAYFHAYALSNKKPAKRRAPAERKAFYEWLYGSGYRYDENDRVIFEEAVTSAFVGKKAEEGRVYRDIPLYEAEYFGESIQFYKTQPVDFIRELRRVAVGYDLDERILGLSQPVEPQKLRAEACVRSPVSEPRTTVE